MPSDDLSAVQAGVDVKVLLTRRLAEAFGDDSDIVDFDDLCDRIKAERGQAASCHVFECRNDRTADSPYCPAHTQITELLAAAPSPPVDREALIGIIEGTDYGAGGWVSRTSTEHAATIADALISAGVVAQPPAWWKGQEIEWNSTGDTWQPGVIIAPLAPVVALIKLHDNGQRLNVETRHLRARGSSREAGQPESTDAYVCKCPGSGTLAHVRGCHRHPEAGQP